MYSMMGTSSATDFPRQAVQPPVSPRAKPWQALPAGEVRRACGAAHLRQCLMYLWCQGMNTGVLQLVGVISVPVIISALPLPLAIVSIPVAYWLISLSCRLFFLSDMTAGDFPGGNRGCHAPHRASFAVSARPLRGSGFPSLCRNVNGRLAATVPVTPPFTRRILRFLHPGKLTPGCKAQRRFAPARSVVAAGSCSFPPGHFTPLSPFAGAETSTVAVSCPG
ncbi:hypothetical protein [Enterobacter asburiae]|uniref:hypothetical protein n=1 Tax=Enterobacter asburiae TaxID=61645 RepID=UPI0015E181B5|nr:MULTISPECIES: hypothetical protein [Enterobacter]UAN18674.1 hypothetical protein KGP20_24635 [Enterobacter asburiae]UAN34115.1 hypothetical protein KGP22_23005 [Enterobacter sp. JBIWA005]